MTLSCHQCRKYLTAYVNNELTPRARRRVDQHLNTCRECSSEYLLDRRTAADITDTLARIGVPSERQLSEIWASVVDNLTPTAAPVITRHSTERRLTLGHNDLRYGVFALILAFALIAPTMFLQGTVHAQLPDPPTPLVRASHGAVSGSPVPDTLLLAATAEAPGGGSAPAAEMTIAFQSNTAPTPGATDSP
ncbi:MAG: zf-HC2 domain-containing protein [Anaerolineae bacterium]